MTPIQICLVARYFYPSYSGPAVRFHRYEPGLRARGLRMSVFCGTPDTEASPSSVSPPPLGTLLPVEEVDGICIQRVQLATGTSDEGVLSRALNAYLQKGENRADVIQLLNLPTIWQLMRLRRLGIPMVFTRTMVSDPSDTAWKRWLHRLRARIRHGLVDCVVVSSGVMRDALREMGVGARIEIIPNGLDLKRFSPASSPEERHILLRQLNLPVDAEILMFVGSISPRKGLDVLAQAWALIAQKYPRAYLVLVGPSRQEIRPGTVTSEFETIIHDSLERSGAENRVIFTGAVENVEAYLRVADLFVFPSHREGMPNVVPEAYGCGVPVIMTPFIGLPQEFGRAGDHYELVERTPGAIAQSISSLLDNRERGRQLALRARKLVEDEMDVEKSLDRYAALYRDLAMRSKKH